MGYKLVKETKGIIITFFGSVRFEDLYALNQQLIADENFRHWRYKVWDFSKAGEVDFSLDEIRSFVFQSSLARHKNPDHKVAIIPRSNPKSGLDDVFHLMSKEWGGYESRSFTHIGAARKWASRGDVDE